MGQRGSSAVLRVLVTPRAAGEVFQTACSTINALGLEFFEPADSIGNVRSASSAFARNRSPDMVVLLVHASWEAHVHAMQIIQPRPDCPVFAFVNAALLPDADMPAWQGIYGLADVPLLHAVRYDGPHDLRWKLGQTLSAFLSARFRQSQAQQGAMLSEDPTLQEQTLLKLAVHRDVQLRQIAVRLAINLADRHADHVQSLLRHLVKSNRTVAFQTVAQILQAMLAKDAQQASTLLHDLHTASPAFRSWVFSRLIR